MEHFDTRPAAIQIRELQKRLKSFESGEEYARIEKLHEKELNRHLREIQRLKKELTVTKVEKTRVRDIWYKMSMDIQKECDEKLRARDREYDRKLTEKDEQLQQLKEELEEARKALKSLHSGTREDVSALCDKIAIRDKTIDKLKQKLECLTKKYEALSEENEKLTSQLEEERGRNQALTARINKDYSNSSKSSSMSPNHKTIHNSREKSGRKPGGQPGHAHHGRKMQKPTETHEIPAPAKYVEDPKFKPTGKIVRKQLVKMYVTTKVIEYWTPEFRNVVTGQRVHADFPPGIVDDVNYDGTVKAAAYIINNDLYTSIDKTKNFMREISHGKINLSTGFICNLSEQFSACTKEERALIFQELFESDVLHADFTFGRAVGKQSTVLISVTNDGKVLYQGRRTKGNQAIKDSPVENYKGTLVSDHESSIMKHGSKHQECLTHVLRYAKGATEVEGLTWAVELQKWIKDTIAYWNEVNKNKKFYNKTVAGKFIAQLKSIIHKAKSEYTEKPPAEYYKEGYNLYRRMAKSFEDYVLFLRDPSVPPTNNIAERFARKFKRKSHQVMGFRSYEGVNRFCDGLSVTESIKSRGENLFEAIADRFNASPP